MHVRSFSVHCTICVHRTLTFPYNWYHRSEIWNMFSPNLSPTLSGKPKFFFHDACQGSERDSGITFTVTDSDHKADSTESEMDICLPAVDFEQRAVIPLTEDFFWIFDVFTRCVNDHSMEDWIYKKSYSAMAWNKNILLIYEDVFEFPNPDILPTLRNILSYQAFPWHHNEQNLSLIHI